MTSVPLEDGKESSSSNIDQEVPVRKTSVASGRQDEADEDWEDDVESVEMVGQQEAVQIVPSQPLTPPVTPAHGHPVNIPVINYDDLVLMHNHALVPNVENDGDGEEEEADDNSGCEEMGHADRTRSREEGEDMTAATDDGQTESVSERGTTGRPVRAKKTPIWMKDFVVE